MKEFWQKKQVNALLNSSENKTKQKSRLQKSGGSFSSTYWNI